MTTPAVGTGDYQKYAQWRSSQITGQVNVAVPFPGGLHFNFNGSSFAALSIKGVNRGTSGLTFTLQTEDNIGGNILDQSSWVLQPGQQLYQFVPLTGEIGSFNITTGNSGGGACNIALKLVNYPPGRVVIPIPLGGARYTSQSVPASGSQSITLPYAGPGIVKLIYSEADASGKLSLEVQEPFENGTSNGSILFDPAMPAVTNQPVVRDLLVGTVGPLLIVRNTDGAAAHTFSASYYQESV